MMAKDRSCASNNSRSPAVPDNFKLYTYPEELTSVLSLQELLSLLEKSSQNFNPLFIKKALEILSELPIDSDDTVFKNIITIIAKNSTSDEFTKAIVGNHYDKKPSILEQCFTELISSSIRDNSLEQISIILSFLSPSSILRFLDNKNKNDNLDFVSKKIETIKVQIIPTEKIAETVLYIMNKEWQNIPQFAFVQEIFYHKEFINFYQLGWLKAFHKEILDVSDESSYNLFTKEFEYFIEHYFKNDHFIFNWDL